MPLPTVTIFGTINKIETRFAQSGIQVTSFQIECSEKNKDGEWENLYIKGAVFGKSAEFVSQWFQDGALCIATGKLVTEVYEGSDGRKRYDIKLKFPNIEFAPKAKQSSDGEGEKQLYQAPHPTYEKHTDYRKPEPQAMPTNTLPDIDIDLDIIPF